MVSAEFCGLVWHGTSIGFSRNRCRPRKRKWELKLRRASELRTGAGSLLITPPSHFRDKDVGEEALLLIVVLAFGCLL